jgi:hypothetical protein
VPIVWKSGSLNILESSGPVQACTGIALPSGAIMKDNQDWNIQGGAIRIALIAFLLNYLYSGRHVVSEVSEEMSMNCFTFMVVNVPAVASAFNEYRQMSVLQHLRNSSQR